MDDRGLDPRLRLLDAVALVFLRVLPGTVAWLIVLDVSGVGCALVRLPGRKCRSSTWVLSGFRLHGHRCVRTELVELFRSTVLPTCKLCSRVIMDYLSRSSSLVMDIVDGGSEGRRRA